MKRMVSHPTSISIFPIFQQINELFLKIRLLPSFSNFVKKAHSFFQGCCRNLLRNLVTSLYNIRFRNVFDRYAIRQMKRKKLKFKPLLIIKSIFSTSSIRPLKNRVCQINETLCSCKRLWLMQRADIHGKNLHERHNRLQEIAEVNPVYCWNRMLFLYRAYFFNENIVIPKPISGKWTQIRQAAWKSIWDTSGQGVCSAAKHDLGYKLFCDKPELESSSPLLHPEHQIHRSDYEEFIRSLKVHIHTHFLKIDAQQMVDNDSKLTLPGTQREWFVIDLATQFWKADPLRKRDDAYSYYLLKCPSQKLLSRHRWEQIVRKRKLDPRPPAARKRGPGKKTAL